MSEKDNPPARTTERGRVLVIDDELGPRESMRFALSGLNIVHCVDSAAKGLAILDEQEIDVVLLDLRMPGMTGIEGLEAIRQRDRNVAVIILTGYASVDTAADAVRLGANEYLTKPFDVDTLKSKVKHHVAESRLRRLRDQAVDKLSNLNDQLRHQLIEQEGLVAMGQNTREMLHDLSNPLSVAYGYTQLMLDNVRHGVKALPADRMASYLARVNTGLEHCKELADLWRGIGGDQGRRRVPLVSLLNEVIETATSEVDSDTVVDCNFVPDADTISVWGSSLQLRRAFSNILVNALQATEKRGGAINLSLAKDDRNAIVSIADDGTGIPEDMLEHIFAPNVSTKETGTGLGLYIVRKIIEAYNGTIQVKSTVGQGTTFCVTLPRYTPADDV